LRLGNGHGDLSGRGKRNAGSSLGEIDGNSAQNQADGGDYLEKDD
jgi:hypothetical protein